MAPAQSVNDALRTAHADHDTLMKRLHGSADSETK
jgi:hypothetical protein